MQVPGVLPRLLALVYEAVLVAALLMVAGFVFQPLHGLLPAADGQGHAVAVFATGPGIVFWLVLAA
jgi:hypothetical protein